METTHVLRVVLTSLVYGACWTIYYLLLTMFSIRYHVGWGNKLDISTSMSWACYGNSHVVKHEQQDELGGWAV